ncbi:MAG: ribonuclease P protein component [Candidatus Nealsonbacteria bacterium CG18_big_fil_WC_8_21_14_2_50_37_10]|uniref:Ribonuclease P protein component n=1 Tax=Candidatus Nealsonbacteria bacterium CG18_big_fil_WC_8_21_14_2_50_37_10 TaxID=1974717 RepID=A0A2H0FLE4_9BACT|nr:MAG: ribonuclease P protein component [Candidatus Nealsonbacteria bacterium CG18_big_fil_WC_8_21_14_2_50_37_10]
MLPKVNRLKKKQDIERVFKKGEGFKEDLLFLKIAKDRSSQTRFAFIISKKVSQKAVIRNRIRRKLSEAVGTRLKKLKKGIDALVIVRPGFAIKDFWEMDEVINKIFAKANILKIQKPCLTGRQAKSKFQTNFKIPA